MKKDLILKNQYSRSTRKILGSFFVTTFILFLTGAVSVPFIFESQTLMYQFGVSRKLLITGHIMGTTAGALVFSQLILISRIKILDRVFSLNRLMLQHRFNAGAIIFLALSHFLLILCTLGTEVLAWNIRQWPEFTGLSLLIMLACIGFSGFFRVYIGVPFRYWMFFHRVVTPVAISLLCVHVYFVSETFHYGGARILILCFITLCLLLYFLNRLRRVRIFRYVYRVDRVLAAGEDIHTVELMPVKERRIINLPGQFVFLKFKSAKISFEEHPFTVSSSPTGSPPIQFTIRSSGDWTEKIRYLDKDDMVFISEPFGVFGHIDMKSSKEMILIAGGIGITPMLSILRYLSDIKSNRRITLLWSVRTRKEVVYPDDFKRLEKSLPGLGIKFLFTREEGLTEDSGRINRARLEELTSGCSRDSVVLICGPPGMMIRVKKYLFTLGFPRRSIVSERFAL